MTELYPTGPKIPPSKLQKKKQPHFAVVPLVILILAQIGTSSDNAALSIATYQLIASLGATVNDIQLANMAYSLAAGAFMIAGGMLGIVIGWKKTFRIGLLLAITGEISLVLAPNMDVFIWCGRVLVGLGASCITPSVLGLVPALYKGRDRAVAFGFIAAAAGASTLVPIPFGILLDLFGYRPTFGLLAGFFVIVLAGTCLLPTVPALRERIAFDFGGLALAASGLLMLLLGISRIASWGLMTATPSAPFSAFGVSPSLLLILAGLLSLTALWNYEKRVESQGKAALIPRSFLSTPRVRASLVAVAMPYFFMAAQGIVMTPFIQIVAGFSGLQTGLIGLLSGVPMLACSMAIPKLLPRTNPWTLIHIGYCLLACAAFSTACGLESHSIGWPVFLGTLLAGTALGIVNSQANNAVASSVDERDSQQSGGIQGAARNVGMALGAAVVGTVMLGSIGITFDVSLKGTGQFDERTHVALVEHNISFMGDEAFLNTIASVNLTEEQQRVAIQANASARVTAARISLVVLALLVLLGLLVGRKEIRQERLRAPGV